MNDTPPADLYESLPAVRQRIWAEAKTACPDCGMRGVPQSWAVAAVEAIKARPWWRRLF